MSKRFNVLRNAAQPSRWGETGPNEPQTAAGRRGASASYNQPPVNLIIIIIVVIIITIISSLSLSFHRQLSCCQNNRLLSEE